MASGLAKIVKKPQLYFFYIFPNNALISTTATNGPAMIFPTTLCHSVYVF